MKKLFSFIYCKLWMLCWKIKHAAHCFQCRKYFRGSVPSIISQNCIGGVMYHDLAMPFLSPTINCFMRFEDFVKFCENIDFYLSRELEYVDSENPYPVAKCYDVTIYFVHYSSFEEVCLKWEIRKKRINKNNIRIIATDRDGATPALINRYLELPYKKILFTNKYSPSNPELVYIPGYEKDLQIGSLIDKREGGKRVFDIYDWVSFLSGKD